MVAATHQAWLSANEVEGRWPMPVFLPVRMRSSTRACGR